MKFKNKFTGKIVEAKKFKDTQQIQVLTEGQLIFAQVLKDQWVVYLDEDNHKILNEDLFTATYEPVKELLLD